MHRGYRRQRGQKGNRFHLQQHHKLSESFLANWQRVIEHRMQIQSKREEKRTGTVHGLCREGAPLGTEFLVAGGALSIGLKTSAIVYDCREGSIHTCCDHPPLF